MKIKIIRAEKKHLDSIIKLWKEMVDFHASKVGPYFKRTGNGHVSFKKFVSGALKKKNMRVTVAVEGNNVLGYALMMISKYPPVYKLKKYGLISDIAVTKTSRRKGAGGMLYQNAVDWFKKRGMKRVELSVAAKNPVGYPFWRKCGFKEIMHRLYQDI